MVRKKAREGIEDREDRVSRLGSAGKIRKAFRWCRVGKIEELSCYNGESGNSLLSEQRGRGAQSGKRGQSNRNG